MDRPTQPTRPTGPADRTHWLLAGRGAALLPEAASADGRVTLTDAMLVVAALAPSFALARSSLPAGLASLAVALPALARTHVVMVRARGLGSSPGAGTWAVAFVSSAIRIGLILGLVAVIEAASLTVGGSMVSRHAGIDAVAGAGLAFVVLGLPLILLALAYLGPRLLSVRDPA